MDTEILQDIYNARRTVAEMAIEKYDKTFVSKYKGCTFDFDKFICLLVFL